MSYNLVCRAINNLISMDNFNTPVAKQTYRKPEFRSYGNIQALTQAVGTTSSPDGSATVGMTMSRT